MSCRCSGMPSSMVEASRVMSASLLVVMRTSSQLIECKECRDEIASMRVEISRSDCAIADTSSCRCILEGWASPVG